MGDWVMDSIMQAAIERDRKAQKRIAAREKALAFTAPDKDKAMALVAERFAHEGNDCAVRAFVVATGKPYPVIHALFKKHGRKDGKGTWRVTSRLVAKELGMRWIEEDCTTQAFLRDMIFARPVVAVMRGHAFAVEKGKIVDLFNVVRPRSRVIGYWTF